MSEVASKVPQLRFPEFSGDWEEKSVGDVLTIGSGRDYKHLNDGDIPVYGTGGYMTSVDNFLYDGESVCIGRKGTIDKPVLINGKFWTVDTLFYTHSFVGLLPKFLFPIFKRINWKKYNEASGVPSLSKSTIEKIKLNLPLKVEQQKIAAFLTAVDNKIEQLSKKQALLGEYKKGLMQQIFSQIIRFKKDDGSEFPDWEEKKLGDVVELKHGYQFRSNDFTKSGLAIIKISNVIGASLSLDDLSFIDKERYSEFESFEIHNGDILMSLTGNIGRVVEVESLPFKAIQNYRVGKFVPVNSKLEKSFLKYLLITDMVFGRFGQLSNQSAQANFGKQDMGKIKVKFPSLPEQTKIANFLSSIDNKIEQVGKQLDESKQFKKALLQQMFV